MTKNSLLLLLPLFSAPFMTDAQRPPISIDTVSTTRHGPEKGSLLLIGGGVLTPDIWKQFTALAGPCNSAIF